MNHSSRDAHTLREFEEEDVTAETLSDGSSPRLPRNSEPDLYLGTVIDGRYAIEQVLGEGGMGVVYLARHRMIDKKVALKILRADMIHDLEMVQRFINEARAASSIGSPHIVNISDFGQTPQGATYFVMEYLEGRNLGALIQEGRIPPMRLTHIARQMAEALSAAHAAGIVHRDLKPDNVMLVRNTEDGEFVKLLDFGIAKVSTLSAEEKRITRAGAVFGTPHYMSPEQASGSSVDHRSDIYSLGVILYEMTAARVPFDAENFMGILSQHMHKAPPPFDTLEPPVKISPNLQAIILRCLQKDAELRYQTMDDVIRDLDAFEQGLLPDAAIASAVGLGGPPSTRDFATPPPLSLTDIPSDRPRWGMLAGVAVGACLFSVFIGGVWWMKIRGGPDAITPDLPVAASAASAASAVNTASPAVPSASPTIQRTIVTEPLGAHVFNGNREIGSTPLKVDGPAHLTLKRAGYVDREIDISDAAADPLVEKLVPVPGRPAVSTAPRPTPAVSAPKVITREECDKSGKWYAGYGRCVDKPNMNN